MDSILANIEAECSLLADQVTKGEFQDENEIETALKELSESDENILGVTAAFEPGQFNDRDLYAPFYDKDKSEFIYCEDFYDYTDPDLKTSQWYVKVRNKGAQWIDPYFAEAAKTMVADFGVPFYRDESRTDVTGTITGTMSLEGLTQLLNSLSLGETGYAFAISHDGTFLSHPYRELIKSQKTLSQLAAESDDELLAEIAERMKAGEEGYQSFLNKVTGQDSWLFYHPVERTNWSIGVVMIKRELIGNEKLVNRKLIHIALSVVLLLISISILFFGALQGEERGLWVVSITTSILVLATISFIWFLEMHSKRRVIKENSTLIADYAGLNSFLRSNESRAEELKTEKPIYIPTGVYVEEMKFIDAYNISVGGLIWQKYTPGLPSDLKEGVSLPQIAPNSEGFYMQEAYREKMPHYEVVGWDFRATLRLDFDYRVYPFDRREIGIKLRQKDFRHNVILTPDFESYQTITPSSLPGTTDELVMPGWQTEASYFDYKIKNYNANFGITDYHGQENVPEFHFNVLLRRHIINPFISVIIPLLVVAIMLFGVVLSTTKNKTKNSLRGFSTFGVVQACAAFFFVIILGHIDMRQGMNTEEITYIEYFYFIMYLVLLTVAFNVVMFSNSAKTRLLDYKDNLAMKLGYWPLLLSICLSVTLVMFY